MAELTIERRGLKVVAKEFEGMVLAKTYANRTQAYAKVAELKAAGIDADVYRFGGRPFFVAYK